MVLPLPLRTLVLKHLHNSPTEGHLALTKTMQRIRDRFYWIGCRRDVQFWCQKCDLCSACKGPPRKPEAPLKLYQVGVPLERVAIDVIGPLPESEKGNKYLLIAIDYFTKWPEAYPLPDQEATTVAEVLVREFICRYAVFAGVCKLLGMHKTLTTPLHPQSDGMVERFNRTIENQLAAYVAENQRDWDQHIPMLLLAYRSSIHEATKCTPARLMLGRDVQLPINLICERPEEEHEKCVPNYVQEMEAGLVKTHEFAQEKLKLASEHMKRRYDAQADYSVIGKGDAVWLYNPQRKKGVSPKVSRPWAGPYVVIKRINDLVYRIQQGLKSKLKVVHRNRLWRYKGHHPHQWLDTEEPSPQDHPLPTENKSNRDMNPRQSK